MLPSVIFGLTFRIFVPAASNAAFQLPISSHEITAIVIVIATIRDRQHDTRSEP